MLSIKRKVFTCQVMDYLQKERLHSADSLVCEYDGQRLTGREGNKRMVNGNLADDNFLFFLNYKSKAS